MIIGLSVTFCNFCDLAGDVCPGTLLIESLERTERAAHDAASAASAASVHGLAGM